jgi:hypothetical protein
MQFYSVIDQSSVKHKILLITLNQKEMTELMGQCEKCIPSIAISSLVRAGHPYVIIDFGGPGGWKTAIPLDKASEDGHPIGDELAVGEVLNVILSTDPNAIKVSRDKTYLNVPLESVLAFSFLYTADIAENYALFKMVKQPKQNSRLN